ncbi:hypothetical protein [Mycobacterium sp. 852002-10029_SCH5224772]|uniref:hypothetical protein n=1 Tax=Mycobacterium sp. 852002-10029_SCH5224772 TaxID=1834083 RepID=UPI0007FC3F9B|nr:hypothetical protein [Mycobacterium sp. 852002-10029_SCH5224772]OBF09628.1 hypothetical protein A5775_20400 [Mycobacterium sp. 852002-10029_SCH5224772]
MNGDELLAANERQISEGFLEVLDMSPLLLACIAVVAPVAGVGLMQLQARLERWDYERHAED